MKHHIRSWDFSAAAFSTVDTIFTSHQDQLQEHLDKLLWWNKRINLVSRNVSRETVQNHILHSLLITQLEPYKKSSLIVDAGTGGGLPGIPLAVASPQKNFLLNDIVKKKTVAIKQMVHQLGLTNAEVRSDSIADVFLDQPFLLISKHAFKINDLWEMTKGKKFTHLIFYKGLDFKKELTGITSPLHIDVYNLGATGDDSFFKEKALVVVKKTPP